ncbi:unnamed protein product [Orchesella dallaii]|uniref:Uncharacterized protein n=1 Tax=Orchesella dallaii TaxID=48710 RepID=A0ABP1RV55_9HEXA
MENSKNLIISWLLFTFIVALYFGNGSALPDRFVFQKPVQIPGILLPTRDIFTTSKPGKPPGHINNGNCKNCPGSCRHHLCCDNGHGKCGISNGRCTCFRGEFADIDGVPTGFRLSI